MRRRVRRLTLGAVVALPLVVGACQLSDLFGSGDAKGSRGPGDAGAMLAAVSGDAQEDTVASTLAEPYRVKVTDARGNPLAGVTVSFTVTEGGGTVSPAEAVTDADGIASTMHTFGHTPGNQAVLAAAGPDDGQCFTFCSQARHGTPVELRWVTDASDAGMGEPIAPALRLVQRDRFGNIATTSQGTATIAITPGSGTPLANAYGTLQASFNQGQATFSNVRIDLPGAGYRLRVVSGSRSTDSRAFDVGVLLRADGTVNK